MRFSPDDIIIKSIGDQKRNTTRIIQIDEDVILKVNNDLLARKYKQLIWAFAAIASPRGNRSKIDGVKAARAIYKNPEAWGFNPHCNLQPTFKDSWWTSEVYRDNIIDYTPVDGYVCAVRLESRGWPLEMVGTILEFEKKDIAYRIKGLLKHIQFQKLLEMICTPSVWGLPKKTKEFCRFRATNRTGEVIWTPNDGFDLENWCADDDLDDLLNSAPAPPAPSPVPPVPSSSPSSPETALSVPPAPPLASPDPRTQKAEEALGNIARISHCGGWANLSQQEALALICKLSFPWWKRGEKEEVAREKLEKLIFPI